MKNWSILVVSVLLACFVWLIHMLSLDYSAYLQYRIKVVTTLEGFAPSAVSEETLLARGKASGFYIMKARGFQDESEELSIEIDPSVLTPLDAQDGTFVASVGDMREKIVESLGEHISIDYFDTESLTFSFVRENFRKVPIVPVTDLTFKDQYMQIGEMTISPDSVLVYGPAAEVDAIDEIRTMPIVRYGLKEDVRGYVRLEPEKGVRISDDRTRYSIDVERYVEMRKTLPVVVANVPGGKSVMSLPSEVSLACRIAFGPQSGAVFNSLSLQVDYDDVVNSLSAKVVPQVKGLSSDVYTYDLAPAIVECVLVEKK